MTWRPYEVLLSSEAWREAGRMTGAEFAELRDRLQQVNFGSGPLTDTVQVGSFLVEIEVDPPHRRLTVTRLTRVGTSPSP